MKQRSLTQMRSDIESGKYGFGKSKQLAPIGYEFLRNYNLKNENEETRTDFRTIEWYVAHGYIVFPTAYNMYGEELDNNVAIYIEKQ